MADDLQEMASEPGVDRLIVPRNPLAPPDWVRDKIADAGKHSLEWMATPGKAMTPHQPKSAGKWSDEDEAIAQLDAQHLQDWASGTAFSEVFWPRTGTNVGGSGFTVGSGATPPRIGRPAELPSVYGKNVPQIMQRAPGIQNIPATDHYSPKSIAETYLAQHGGDRDAAVAQMEKVLRLSSPHPQTDALRQAIESLRPPIDPRGPWGQDLAKLKDSGYKLTPVEHDPFK